ncbi:MAG: efflux RND transporter periplasmic adaptor subunit [Desulfobacterales bacterium]|nr:efflux RND transporter periplasmic adaptor subunit [Desulfobacterales bacterium]
MTGKIRIIVHALLALAVVGIGLAGFYLLKSSREALGRQEQEPSLPIVRTVPVEFGNVDMKLAGEGTVRPVAETRIVPQVGGRVIYASENLVNGGSFKKGELMLAIEPDDYEIAVTLARAGLRDAESNYQTALQESLASVSEWKSLHPDKEPPPLVARKPQLEAARASVEAQKANLEKARLNLKRTKINAPFDCRVSSEQVDEGQYVSPGQGLATLYSTKAAEIVVPMESGDLYWFDVPGFTTEKKRGSPVRVFADAAGGRRTWKGEVVRTKGKIDEKTRMVDIVIRVPDPFGKKPPLAPGQFAEVQISGRSISDAAVIPRAALRGENTVWAVNPETGRLYIRTVDIAHLDSRGAVVKSGLKPGEQVAVSVLKAVTDGMKVKHVDISREGDS